jgi:hypothetical protein
MAEFAVEAIRRWWRRMGKKRYKKPKRLLITADSGGSNGHRNRLWKFELQRLADETGMTIEVCHYPPGTSKWNKIEHRLFCHITRNGCNRLPATQERRNCWSLWCRDSLIGPFKKRHKRTIRCLALPLRHTPPVFLAVTSPCRSATPCTFPKIPAGRPLQPWRTLSVVALNLNLNSTVPD